MDPLTIALAGGALGGIAGGMGSKQKQVSQRILPPASELEKQTDGLLGSQLTQLQNLTGMGPGEQDVAAGLNAQRGLADLLAQFSQGGFLPQQNDFQMAQQFTNQAFAPQQLAMSQQFADEDLELQRLAARLGRSPNDPVLRNKLAQTRGNLQAQLGAQQTSFMSQFAQQLPQQRLGFAQQLSQVQGDLASQALRNRQALLSLGQGIRAQEQNFRVNASSSISSGTGGGGVGGTLGGALGGFGTFAGAANNLNSLLQSPPQPKQPQVSLGQQAFAGYGVA